MGEIFLENVRRDQCMRDERIYGRLLGEKILLLPAENHDLLVFLHSVRLRLVDKNAWLQGALLLCSLGFYRFRIHVDVQVPILYIHDSGIPGSSK